MRTMRLGNGYTGQFGASGGVRKKLNHPYEKSIYRKSQSFTRHRGNRHKLQLHQA